MACAYSKKAGRANPKSRDIRFPQSVVPPPGTNSTIEYSVVPITSKSSLVITERHRGWRALFFVVRKYPTGRFDGDIDKLMRGMLDAMTGIVYKDDSQVIRGNLEQDYTDSLPGVWITISDDV